MKLLNEMKTRGDLESFREQLGESMRAHLGVPVPPDALNRITAEALSADSYDSALRRIEGPARNPGAYVIAAGEDVFQKAMPISFMIEAIAEQGVLDKFLYEAMTSGISDVPFTEWVEYSEIVRIIHLVNAGKEEELKRIVMTASGMDSKELQQRIETEAMKSTG